MSLEYWKWINGTSGVVTDSTTNTHICGVKTQVSGGLEVPGLNVNPYLSIWLVIPTLIYLF